VTPDQLRDEAERLTSRELPNVQLSIALSLIRIGDLLERLVPRRDSDDGP
jgi:hypothetical protein